MAKKEKADVNQVKKVLAPYVQKRFFGRDLLEEQYIRPVALLLLGQYQNITICQGVDPGVKSKPWMKITVKGFLFSEEIMLEVLPNRKGRNAKKGTDWIDRIEEWEAFMED